MLTGRVIGQLWASQKVRGLANQKLVLVAQANTNHLIVATDNIDTYHGANVLVTWGSGARHTLKSNETSAAVISDAAIALIDKSCS